MITTTMKAHGYAKSTRTYIKEKNLKISAYQKTTKSQK
jgi:hypothetical protein